MHLGNIQDEDDDEAGVTLNNQQYGHVRAVVLRGNKPRRQQHPELGVVCNRFYLPEVPLWSLVA